MLKKEQRCSRNEVKRLAALARYKVLDTEPEAVFDDLTRLAVKECVCPIALMTLIDENRQWFKSVAGINIKETVRSVSFCTYTIEQAEVMIVPDTLKDDRFADNPLVTSEPKIRFYAGAPLITSDGFKLGTLCVIDQRPRTLTLEQTKMLKILAHQAMMHLELRFALGNLAAQTLELKSAYAELSESEQRFRSLFEQAGVGAAQISVESGRFIEVNQKYAEILGYANPTEMKGICLEATVFHADLAIFWEQMSKMVLEQPRAFSTELRMVQKGGNVIWASLEVSPLCRPSGSPSNCIAVVQDITARKSAELELEKALERETVFNRELHHRVKNNLQIISSLLFLQAQNANDPEVIEVIQQSQSRIHSVALIHEKLYRSTDLTRVEFSDYAWQLASDLISVYKTRGYPSICLSVEVGNIRLGLDAAVPCGFILTELIANALKHAFPGRDGGQLAITLACCEGGSDDRLQLEVCDNGAGLPKDFNLDESKSLGLKLVKDLVRQLDGTIEFINRQGTMVRITLRNT